MTATLELARQLLGFNTINPPGSEADCMRFFASASWLNMLRSTVMMGFLSAMALSFYLVLVNMSNVCFCVLFR